MQKFRTAISSISGRRAKNEDNCTVLELGKHTHFLAVADGMGGIKGGEIASRITIDAIEDYLRELFIEDPRPEELKDILSQCFIKAQTRIAEEVKENPALQGMGTTLAALLINRDDYVWGNIGDSRVYILSGGTMRLITEDHSYIQEYLNKSSDKLPAHILSQYGNVVTRIIDGGNDVPDIFPDKEHYLTLHKGDLFLLCSDGIVIDKTEDLTHFLREFIDEGRSLKKMAGNIVSWAFERGSTDNISVVLGSSGSIKKVKKQDTEHKTIVIKKT